ASSNGFDLFPSVRASPLGRGKGSQIPQLPLRQRSARDSGKAGPDAGAVRGKGSGGGSEAGRLQRGRSHPAPILCSPAWFAVLATGVLGFGDAELQVPRAGSSQEEPPSPRACKRGRRGAAPSPAPPLAALPGVRVCECAWLPRSLSYSLRHSCRRPAGGSRLARSGRCAPASPPPPPLQPPPGMDPPGRDHAAAARSRASAEPRAGPPPPPAGDGAAPEARRARRERGAGAQRESRAARAGPVRAAAAAAAAAARASMAPSPRRR
ncbi:hypothetical protein MC885_003914, partial [Smutsia gigantea]